MVFRLRIYEYKHRASLITFSFELFFKIFTRSTIAILLESEKTTHPSKYIRNSRILSRIINNAYLNLRIHFSPRKSATTSSVIIKFVQPFFHARNPRNTHPHPFHLPPLSRSFLFFSTFLVIIRKKGKRK